MTSVQWPMRSDATDAADMQCFTAANSVNVVFHMTPAEIAK